MQRFRQLSVPLDFGGTGSGFTITLTGPSYIAERLSPRTEPSGIEPETHDTFSGSRTYLLELDLPPPPGVGVKSFGG